MSSFPVITVATLIPVLGGLVLLGLDASRPRLSRGLALLFVAVTAVTGLGVWWNFEPGQAGMQFVERWPWIPSLAVEYHVGVDGLGLVMVLLTIVVMPLAVLVTPADVRLPQVYYGLMLLLQGGLLGVFTALNFFHWFLFWELSLIPAFFLVRLWGGPARGPAATQFFLYTMVGSVALLLAFVAIFLATGQFNFLELAELGRANRWAAYFNVRLGGYALPAETLVTVVFLGVFLGFAVKVPVMPFHTWLPAAYAEAPSSTTMVLTGLMSKMGVYGLLRILVPLFPESLRACLTPLLWLAVLTIVASAAAAFAQRDLKRMLAYSSINHLGYCLLGIFAALAVTQTGERLAAEQAAALNGVVLQMFNHGLTAATLFGFVAYLEQRTGGRRAVQEFGGLRATLPVFNGLMGIAVFASLGLPGLNGFVGEFLIFKGAFALVPWATALSTVGLLITAVFLLTFLHQAFHGPPNPRWAGLADLTWAERCVLGPAILLMLVLGLYPQLLLGLVNPTVVRWIAQLSP